jgi:hypothetical protein
VLLSTRMLMRARYRMRQRRAENGAAGWAEE